MHTLSRLLSIAGLAWCLAACASQAEVEAPFVELPQDSRALLDGITNGLDRNGAGSIESSLLEVRVNGAVLDAASSDLLAGASDVDSDGYVDELQVDYASSSLGPSAGAFFSDGGDGDVRARTENFFQRTAASASDPSQRFDDFGATQDIKPAAPGTIGTGDGQKGGRVDRAANLAASRKMIRAGQLGLEVPRVDDTLTWLQQRAEELGGFMAQRSGPRIVLRVPAAVFAAFVDEVKKKGRVLHEDVSAQDVTEDYQDVKLRLENLQSARKRLVALLDKAEAIKDVLSIEKELTRMTEEIERLTGRLKFLDDRITLATLTVQLAGRVDQAEPQRRQSRFPWIRMVGVEHVWNAF